MQDKPTVATAIRTVSTVVEFDGDNIIISAGTEERLRAFMEMIVEPVGEIRQTGVVVGPVVECPPFAWVRKEEAHEEQPEPIENEDNGKMEHQ